METTTFEQDPEAARAAAAARERLEGVLEAAVAKPGTAVQVPTAESGSTQEARENALARATAIAQIVAHYDADPAMVGGTLLYVLIASGCALEDRAAARGASPGELAFARALLRLGRFDISAQWRESAGDALAGTQAESLRKMLLAVVDDPRLVLVRVAEQLCALREAKSLDDVSRRRLARQAREVYGPLANRLGLAQLKWELEDHAFRHLEPAEYQRIAASLNERRADRERYIAMLRTLLTDELGKSGIVADVQGRPKHIYSIWRKMTRKQLAFEQVFDVRAVRIVVGTIAECYAALGVVHGQWPYVPGEFDDYVATPKPNGYRSIHTAVIGPQGKAVEIQIRTHEMHERAELGVAAHWHYKEGGRRDLGFERKLERLRVLLAPAPAAPAGGDPDDLLERLGARLFADHVYVLSPKGDVVELPAGATPLDFAYHVHTDLGHRCRGAKVDGRMVPLDHRLANGETVEIIAAKEPQPSRDWLVESRGFLASRTARAKVRAFFRREDEDDHRQAGLVILERELARLGAQAGARAPVAVAALAAELGEDRADDLYVALGAGDRTPTQLANAIQRLQKAAEPPPAMTTLTVGTAVADGGAAGVSVMGVADLMSSYAQCCRPVPPEAVAGYVTVGRGVTIHRADCPNLRRLGTKQPDRIVEVGWGADASRRYGVEVAVQAYDRRGLLRDITGAFADAKLSIDRLQTVTHHAENLAAMTLAVRVHDLRELDAVLARVRALPDVLVARRK